MAPPPFPSHAQEPPPCPPGPTLRHPLYSSPFREFGSHQTAVPPLSQTLGASSSAERWPLAPRKPRFVNAHLLLFGILRVHIRRPQPWPLQGPVFVAQDPEGRHFAQPVAPEAPAGPAPGRGRGGAAGGRRWRGRRPRDNGGQVRNSRSLPETTEGNRGTPETVGQYRPQRGGAGPAWGGAPLPGTFRPEIISRGPGAERGVGMRTCEKGSSRAADL